MGLEKEDLVLLCCKNVLKTTNSLDDKKEIDIIYLDFKFDFDRVPHQSLSKEMAYMYWKKYLQMVGGFFRH